MISWHHQRPNNYLMLSVYNNVYLHKGNDELIMMFIVGFIDTCSNNSAPPPDIMCSRRLLIKCRISYLSAILNGIYYNYASASLGTICPIRNTKIMNMIQQR